MAVRVNEKICTGCGICETLCPVDAIRIEDGKARVTDNCLRCGVYVRACPVGAIRKQNCTILPSGQG